MPLAFRPNRLATYDDDSVLAEIKRVVTEHFGGIVPAIEEFNKFSMVSGWVIRQRFGTWANAVRKAGFEYAGQDYQGKDLRRVNYTEDRMISDLERVKQLNGGRYFSFRSYKASGGKYSAKALRNRFQCTWQTLLKERLSVEPSVTIRLKTHNAGMKRVSDHTEHDLFSELARVWDSLGRRPSYSEFKRLGRIGVKVYERRFGNWKTAVARFFAQTGYRSVGLPGSHATPELLLAELAKLLPEARTPFTFARYRHLGGAYSIGAFQRHFGSWKAAVVLVGSRDGHSGKYSNEELFSEIQRLWEEFGRQPTFQTMNRQGQISAGAFQRRFGSWMKAIHAFCEDRRSLNEEQIAPVPTSALNVNPLPSEPCAEKLAPSRNLPVAENQNTVLVDSRRGPGKRLRFRVLQRDAFRCVLCGRSPQTHAGVVLQVDHTVPWSRGGLTVYENLRTTCEDCNGGKSDLLPEASSQAGVG